MRWLPDIEPLRRHPAYRRLYTGFTLSGIGSQMATVAIGLQVYAITSSTAAVGLVGVFALVPLVAMGLYGGALADHHDRRIVATAAQAVAWATSIVCAVQACLGNERVLVLYLLVASWNGAYAVSSPARSSIYPRILPAASLPRGQRPVGVRDEQHDDRGAAAGRGSDRLAGLHRGLSG